MKLTVSQKSLAKVLGTVGHLAAGYRGSMPILGGVHLVAEGGKLRCESTNLDQSLAEDLAAEVQEPGRVAVPAQMLAGLVATLVGERVELEGATTQLKVRCGGHQSTVRGWDAQDWPALPQSPERPDVRVGAQALRSALAQVVACAAKDDSRPALAGVCFDQRGEALSLVASDGFRLAWRRFPVEPVERDLSRGEEASVLLPAKAAAELIRAIGSRDERVGVSLVGDARGQIVFALEDLTLAARLVEAKFPSYHQIIPTEAPTRVLVERERLAAAVRAARLIGGMRTETKGGATYRFWPISLVVESASLVVRAMSEEGDVADAIPATVEGPGVLVGFNSEYLADALAALETDRVSLALQSAARAGVLRPEDRDDHLVVLMPMHLKEQPAAEAEGAREEAVA